MPWFSGVAHSRVADPWEPQVLADSPTRQVSPAPRSPGSDRRRGRGTVPPAPLGERTGSFPHPGKQKQWEADDLFMDPSLPDPGVRFLRGQQKGP